MSCFPPVPMASAGSFLSRWKILSPPSAPVHLNSEMRNPQPRNPNPLSPILLPNPVKGTDLGSQKCKTPLLGLRTGFPTTAYSLASYLSCGINRNVGDARWIDPPISSCTFSLRISWLLLTHNDCKVKIRWPTFHGIGGRWRYGVFAKPSEDEAAPYSLRVRVGRK